MTAQKTNKNKYVVAVFFLVLLGFVYSLWSFNEETSDPLYVKLPACDETTRTGCEYEGSKIFSDLDSLLWMRDNIPAGSGVLAWWDYGKELKAVSQLEPVIKEPSLPLMKSVACFQDFVPANKRCSEEDFAPLEPEEEVRDVARFFTTTDEKEALCIAKKYDARYVFLPILDTMNKFPWITYADTGEMGSGYMRGTPRTWNSTSISYELSGNEKVQLTREGDKWIGRINGQPLRKIVDLLNGTTYEIQDYTINATALSYSDYLLLGMGTLGDNIFSRLISAGEPDIPNLSRIYSKYSTIYALDLEKIQCP